MSGRVLVQEGTRPALWAAAREWHEWIFDPEKAAESVHVFDEDGALSIISGTAVLAVRMIDPEAAKGSQRVGFVLPEA